MTRGSAQLFRGQVREPTADRGQGTESRSVPSDLDSAALLDGHAKTSSGCEDGVAVFGQAFVSFIHAHVLPFDRPDSSRCRKHEISWSFTMPTACMNAYVMVDPTNRKPRLRRSLLRASDSRVDEGRSRSLVQRFWIGFPFTNPQT